MKERNAAEEDLGYVSGMVFTPDGKRLATANLGGRVVLWDPETAAKLDEFPFPGPVRAIAAGPDSRHLATANANGTIYVLRLASPPPRRK
jgi:WD40 repeat protein